MTLVDELAGIRWRRGLSSRWPRLWLDRPRRGALALLTDADVPVPPRARVLATPEAAERAGLAAGRALRVPYGQPFQLGQGAVELLPSGASPGGAIVRLNARGHTTLVVGPAQTLPLDGCAPLQLREADLLVIDANLAGRTTLAPSALEAELHLALLAQTPAVWLLEHPLWAEGLLASAQGALRVAPPLRRLLLRGQPRPLPLRLPGRRAEGVLLWPLAARQRLPAAWREVPQRTVGEPSDSLTPDLPFARRLAGAALLDFVRQSGISRVLAWGQGASQLAAQLQSLPDAARRECAVLRVPYQLSLM